MGHGCLLNLGFSGCRGVNSKRKVSKDHTHTHNTGEEKKKVIGREMESTLKALRDGESVLDLSPRSTVSGGVEDIYGEDRATEDQLVIPWTVSVASGYSLLRDPQYNKGLAFTEKERDAHYLRGLLPPTEKKLMNSIRQYQVPLQKYVAMMDLQERNERLFYKLLIDNVEELLPVVYAPTVGEA
ncbi:hypothetical protein AAZV13_08G031900 [Glycine max]